MLKLSGWLERVTLELPYLCREIIGNGVVSLFHLLEDDMRILVLIMTESNPLTIESTQVQFGIDF